MFPASTQTTTFNHYPQIAYDRIAVETLVPNMPFYAACEKRSVPLNSGKTLQVYVNNLMSANTNPATEGTVIAGVDVTDATTSLTLNQYADYISFSDFEIQTDFADVVQRNAVELGRRAALTVNTLVKNAFEVAIAGTDGSTTTNSLFVAHGLAFSRSIAAKGKAQLEGRDVKPKANGFYMGICHPFQGHDFLNEGSTNGAADIMKRYNAGIDQLKNGIDPAKQQLAVMDGVIWVQTTTVGKPVISANQNYNAYVTGNEAILAASLGNYKVPEDGRNFKAVIKMNLQDDKSDPAGLIGSYCSYNFKLGVGQRPGTTMALYRIQSEGLNA
jgi:N4-gp56 family major capsid protein